MSLLNMAYARGSTGRLFLIDNQDLVTKQQKLYFYTWWYKNTTLYNLLIGLVFSISFVTPHRLIGFQNSLWFSYLPTCFFHQGLHLRKHKALCCLLSVPNILCSQTWLIKNLLCSGKEFCRIGYTPFLPTLLSDSRLLLSCIFKIFLGRVLCFFNASVLC